MATSSLSYFSYPVLLIFGNHIRWWANPIDSGCQFITIHNMHFESNPNPLAECLMITDEWGSDGTNIGEPNQQRQQKCTLLLAECNHCTNHPCTGIIQWFSYWLHHHPHPTIRVHLLSSSPALPFDEDLPDWTKPPATHTGSDWGRANYPSSVGFMQTTR